ncbi:MAG: CocE/NonD family hydrolase [Lysobacterales bacterium]
MRAVWVLSLWAGFAWAQTGTAPPDLTDVAAAQTTITLEAPDERAQAIRAGYTKYEYRIPMRDGVRLFTAAYVPNDASKTRTYPLLMVRTPYSVAPYGLDRYKAALGPTEAYEKEGFIFVFQDVRGQHMSEGEFVNMRPHRPDKRGTEIDESSDSYDTIEWLLKHVAHHNGKVGQWGISYPGFYASMAAIDSHPALKAVSPQAPIADWWRGDDMHRHGAFNLQLSYAFFSGFGKPRPAPTDKESWDRFDFGTPDGYQYFLDLGSLANVPSRFKEPIAFWSDIVAHPDYDDFWKARSILPHLKNVGAATLVVGGWYDTEDLYGPLQTYAAIERGNPKSRNMLVMGPWPHGGWARGKGNRLGDAEFGFNTAEYFQPLGLAFFKQYLKDGEEAGLPEALVFETGANRWRRFEQWPPAAAQPRRLYFHAGGQLDWSPPAVGGADDYPSDPAKPVPYTQEISQRWSRDYMTEDQRFAARRPDVLVYQTAPLEQDLTLAGPLHADLWFSTSATDADVVIKLIDVSPGDPRGWDETDLESGRKNRGGQQTLVRGEPFRGRYRESYEQPLPFTPDLATPVNFAINDVFHTFQRGHRIMIQVQSTWFPFIDRNPQTFVPNIFEAKAEDFVRATHRIHRSPEQASSVEVRVLPAADAATD